jgi:hypothetical protein
MKKLILSSIFAVFSTQLFAENPEALSGPNLIGFDCASEFNNVIGILGRGELLTDFLAKDVSAEIKRQNQKGQVISIKCDGKPTIKASYISIIEEEAEQKIVSTLSFTIPLEVRVRNDNNSAILKIDHNYYVKNLDKPGKQKTTQNFIVKNSNH